MKASESSSESGRDVPPRARRLFVALQPPPALAETLLALTNEALSSLAPESVRLYPAEHLHLTLVFLGDVRETIIPDLERALASALRGLRAPRLAITHTGAFPSAKRPRVAWAGFEESDDLQRVHSRVIEAVRSCGLDPRDADAGRSWTPHLTLARPRGAGTLVLPSAFLELALRSEWPAESVLLVESHLHRPLAERYETRRSLPLTRDV